MTADALEELGDRIARRRRVSSAALSRAVLLTGAARELRTLVSLSREGDDA